MATADATLEQLRETARHRIEECRLAGQDTRHNRSANLQAIQNVVDHDSHYTWDITGVDTFSFDEILDTISGITGCSSDPEMTAGGGYISPNATLKALEAASSKIAAVARRGAAFCWGTGHPGSLLFFYIELARLIRQWGGRVRQPARGECSSEPGAGLYRWRGGHNRPRQFDALSWPSGDGYDDRAGIASRSGRRRSRLRGRRDQRGHSGHRPDGHQRSALALAHRLGADVLIIPMDDNRPLGAYLPIIETIREFGELFEPELAASRSTAGDERRSVRVADDQLLKAESVAAQRIHFGMDWMSWCRGSCRKLPRPARPNLC